MSLDSAFGYLKEHSAQVWHLRLQIYRRNSVAMKRYPRLEWSTSR